MAEAETFEAEVVGVGTRTRSSLGRGLLRSVAEEVLRRAPIAVMLVGPAA